MANSMIPSGFVKSVLQNGVGRYICQLQRVTIKFCKSKGNSKGVRDFIQRDLVEFARNNPGVVVYLKPRRHRSPAIVAEYLNGKEDYISCHNFTCEEVAKWLEHMKTKSGIPIVRLRKHLHTGSPSIQGVWTPFTNASPSLNVTSFPDKSLSDCPEKELSATDIVLEMTKNMNQLNGEESSDLPPNVVTEKE